MIEVAAISLPELTRGDQLVFEVMLTLGVAVPLGIVLQRLGQSLLLGYLLAGVLLGPGALAIVTDRHDLAVIAELGLALLLFTIGLELPLNRIARIGRTAMFAGAAQIALTVLIATPLVHLTGLSWAAAVVFGMAISLSSTAVVMRVLADRAELDSVHGMAAMAMLVVQDIATVAFLLVVPQLAGGGDIVHAAGTIALSMVKLLGLVVALWLIDVAVVRRLFPHASVGHDRELLAILSIVLSIGAAGAAQALDLSPAIGAFVAGLLIGDAPYSDQVRAEIAPVRAALLALFFASVGMLADLGWMARHWPLIIIVVVVLVVLKFATAVGALYLARVSTLAAVLAGAALAQLGEFSFAIVASARAEGIVSQQRFQLFVAASLITLALTPFLIAATSRLIDGGVGRGVRRHPGSDDGLTEASHAVVVGYGPAGARVVAALRDAGVETVVIELAPSTKTLPEESVRVVYGDAARTEILQAAHVESASCVIITIPDPRAARRIVRQARAMSRGLRIIARGRYFIYVDQIRGAGADAVVDEETETGNQLAREALAVFAAR